MDYLQYIDWKLWGKCAAGVSFKPYYKWITFNTWA